VSPFAWRASARSQSTRPSRPGAPTKSPRRKPGDMFDANLRHRAAVRLAGLRPLIVNPALPAWSSHKKPPAEAGGHRVACLPGCHAMWGCTGTLRAVMRHGRRGGCSCPESPGFHPGLLGPATGPIPCSRVGKTRFAAGSLQRRRSVELLRAPSKKRTLRGYESVHHATASHRAIFDW